MEEYVISIEDGEGKINLIEGNYSAQVETNGYDNLSLTPSSIEITNDKNEYTFTVSASGTLMIYAYDGQSGVGHQIEGATFYRCTSDGTKYGEPVVTDSSGFAYLSNLPYSEKAPAEIFFIQTASDGNHTFSTEVQSINLTIDIGNSVLIENPLIT